jgi:molecular chaperone DnaK
MSSGIDFGTSNSVVAQWTGSDVEVLLLDSRNLEGDWKYTDFEYLFPSVVGTSSLRQDTLFGWEAKLRSEEVVEAAKRLLQSNEPVTVRGRQFKPTTVAAGMFAAMREGAEANLTELTSAVVTVPANASGAARYRTRASAHSAGISVQALLNEPTAAAVSYMHDIADDGTIMVFDWGGGTIDVTVLECVDGVFEERTSRGITQLGGIEVDARLRELILAKLGREPRWTSSLRRQFDLGVERTKIRLSSEESVQFAVPGLNRIVDVSRAELESAIKDLLDKALRPAKECLRDFGKGPEYIDDILLIGGTSQMPCVRQAVAELMEDEPVAAALCHPMTAVARGAAIASAILDGEIQVSTMYALGTMVQKDGKRSFSTIIPRNSSLPASQSKSYTPNRDFAIGLKVSVWEGDADKPVDDPGNVLLTELDLKYEQPGRREDRAFKMEYTYDESGILHVRATLVSTGEVVLDQEVDHFGSGGTEPDIAAELLALIRPGLAPAR